MPSAPHQELRDAIIDGMARYLWVTAYAEWATDPTAEGELAAVGTGRPGPGEDWDDYVPLTPSAAVSAAHALERTIGEDNGAPTSRVLVELLAAAMTVDMGRPYRYEDDPSDDSGDHDVASEFGAALAAQALGAGSSWFDSHGSRRGLFDRETLMVPDFEVIYDGKQMSWSCTPCSGDAPWRAKAGHDEEGEPCEAPADPDDDVEDDEPKPASPPPRPTLVNPVVSRILVIEDDPQLQTAMRRIIKRLYPAGAIDLVDNASDAIDLIAAHPPDLILSDYDIVGSTGGDVLAYIQHAHPQLVHRFIFISGNDIIERLHPHHLQKPATMKQIAEAIESLPHDNPAAWPRSQVQSLLFARESWTEPRAKAWAREHGYHYGMVDVTARTVRLRQFAPTGAPCRTIQLGSGASGIQAVVCRGRG